MARIRAGGYSRRPRRARRPRPARSGPARRTRAPRPTATAGRLGSARCRRRGTRAGRTGRNRRRSSSTTTDNGPVNRIGSGATTPATSRTSSAAAGRSPRSGSVAADRQARSRSGRCSPSRVAASSPRARTSSCCTAAAAPPDLDGSARRPVQHRSQPGAEQHRRRTDRPMRAPGRVQRGEGAPHRHDDGRHLAGAEAAPGAVQRVETAVHGMPGHREGPAAVDDDARDGQVRVLRKPVEVLAPDPRRQRAQHDVLTGRDLAGTPRRTTPSAQGPDEGEARQRRGRLGVRSARRPAPEGMHGATPCTIRPTSPVRRPQAVGSPAVGPRAVGLRAVGPRAVGLTGCRSSTGGRAACRAHRRRREGSVDMAAGTRR